MSEMFVDCPYFPYVESNDRQGSHESHNFLDCMDLVPSTALMSPC